jgi:hypothetical protein
MDPSDPKHGAYQAERRKKGKETEALKPRTLLAEGDDAQQVQRRSLAAMEAAAAAAAGSGLRAGSAASSSAAGGGKAAPKAKSLLGMFELGAAWTIKELADGLGLREADIKAQVQERCDYVRAGPFNKRWLCKAEFRTPSMPQPDPEAAANRVTGGGF